MKQFDPKEVYDHLGPRYEKFSQLYWHRYGERLVEQLAPKPGMRVLDVACGTGSSAIPAASAVGRTGHVVALDISPGMLAFAKDKANAAGLDNIDLVVSDMRRLELRAESFDQVMSAFGIFFAEDMAQLLSALWRLVKPGGKLGIATWARDFLQPMYGYWKRTMAERLRDGEGALPWERLHEDNLLALLAEAGVSSQVALTTMHEPMSLRPPERWWEVVNSTGLCRSLENLTAEARESVRRENLGHIEQAGITELDIAAVFVVARKPNR